MTNYKNSLIRKAGVLYFLCLSGGIVAAGEYQPPPPIPDDRVHLPVTPKSRQINLVSDGFYQQISRQINEFFDFSRTARWIARRPKQSKNVNTLGEVLNSSWFTPRNHVTPLSLEKIKRGPDTGIGPDTSDVWTIFRAKAEGVTPGFHILDSRCDRYVIKFDPIGYSGMTTGAEVVCTKLFHAMGYNTPENYIIYFHPRILRMGEKVKFKDEKGRDRFMTEADLEEILGRVQLQPDGTIRVVASKYLAGTLLGPFRYRGTRKDDPNDFVPHQHRRELRGMRVICAWLNHHDTKAGNSQDVYVVDGSRSYVRHYMMDFGSTLGAQAEYPNNPYRSHENMFDPKSILVNTLSLGLYVRPYDNPPEAPYPSIGLYTSQYFHPQRYKFLLPNPAFENMTGNDGYWGAKIVMSFSDEQIATAVSTGQYENREAADYLTKMIIERRDIVGRYWFERMNPLDNFELSESPGGGQELRFTDLAVDYAFQTQENTSYRCDIQVDDVPILTAEELDRTSLRLPDAGDNPSQGPRQLEVTLRTRRGTGGQWSKWVKVYLAAGASSGNYRLIGIQRQE
jgi:hypothetical protein